MGVGRLSRSELLTHGQCPCACQNTQLWECPSSPPTPPPAALPVAQPCTVPTWGRGGQKSCQVFQQDVLAITSWLPGLGKGWTTPPDRGAGSQVAIKSPPGESSSLSALPPPAHIGRSSCRNHGPGCPVSGPCPAWGPAEPGPGFNSELDPCPISAQCPPAARLPDRSGRTLKGCCRRGQGNGADGRRSQVFPRQHWVGWLGLWEARVQASAQHHSVRGDTSSHVAQIVTLTELHGSVPPLPRSPLVL